MVFHVFNYHSIVSFMNNLYIVRTPLQLFNAFEARQRFTEIGTKNILLLVYGNMNDYSIFKKMAYCLMGWDEIKFFKFKGILKNLYAFKLPFLLNFHCQYNSVFTGMIHHIPLHLMNCLNAKNYWLIDDGNETRMIVDHLNQGTYYTKDRSQLLFGIKQNPEILKKIQLFTLYEDLVTAHKVTINDYRIFKKYARELETKVGYDLVIGSNLIGTYIKSEAEYLNILISLKQQLAHRHLYYAPHRYLSENTVQAIESMGYQILKYDTILELFQYEQGWCFERYYSIRSTAIDTLTQLYGAQGTFMRLDESYFVNHSKWQECNEIWNTAQYVISLETSERALN